MSCRPCLVTVGIPCPTGAFDLTFGAGGLAGQRPLDAYKELVRIGVGHNGTPNTVSGLNVGTPSEPRGIVETADISGEGAPIETCAPLDLALVPLRITGTLNGAQQTTINLTFKL